MTTMGEKVDPGLEASPAARQRPRWLRQWWVILLAIYCLGFAVYGGYRYLTLDPALSRVPLRSDVPFHYALLTTHVLTGMVAISLGWMQLWPWLRGNQPKIHRRTGYVYFLAGVFPSCLLAFPVAILTPAGQGIRVVLLVMATLWGVTAIAGFRAVRQGRYDDHRRWMMRNVAMTTTIVTSRWLGMIGVELTLAVLPGTYGNQERLVFEEMNASALWAAIVIHLFFVEWFVLRPRRRRRQSKETVLAA